MCVQQGAVVAGGGELLALEVSEQQWEEYLLGMLRKGDDVEHTAALQDFTS